MNRIEFNIKLNQIGADYQSAIAALYRSSGSEEFKRRAHEAIEQEYVTRSIALQREMGIKTPVEFGRTE